MAKKCIIVTFHCVPNYGAVLQAYAMQQYMKRENERVELLDYRPNSIMKEYKYINFHSIFSALLSLWSLPSYYLKLKAFKCFGKRYLTLSREKGKTGFSFEGIQADVVLLGSDQIWNSQITGGIDPVYYGQLPWRYTPRIISYAASVGKKDLDDVEASEISSLLNKLDYLSVREYDARDALLKVCDRPIEVVLDPTLLAGVECFKPLVTKQKIMKEYLLIYSLNGYKETTEMAKAIADRLHLSVIEISGRRRGLKMASHKTLYSSGPEEFVSLIANANFVVTDSFHGTVFSLLFHKEFVTVPHKTRGSRITNLLEVCGLQNRVQSEFVVETLQQQVNWEEVDAKLAQARENSEKYLHNALNGC